MPAAIQWGWIAAGRARPVDTTPRFRGGRTGRRRSTTLLRIPFNGDRGTRTFCRPMFEGDTDAATEITAPLINARNCPVI